MDLTLHGVRAERTAFQASKRATVIIPNPNPNPDPGPIPPGPDPLPTPQPPLPTPEPSPVPPTRPPIPQLAGSGGTASPIRRRGFGRAANLDKNSIR